MKTKTALLASLLMMLCLPFAAVAQQTEIAPSDSSVVMRFRIFYPVNRTEIFEDYMDNAVQLHHIREYLKKSPRIDSITIYSYASPEGPYRLNKMLASERGKTAKRYLQSLMPADRQLPDSLIVLDPTAENWEGLREKILYQYPYDDKDEVLALLDRTDISDARRKVMLQRMNRGTPWVYILKEIMPQLRYATWISVWQRIAVDKIGVETISQPLAWETTEPKLKPLPLLIHAPQAEDTKTILALKTNLLYDALSALNFEVEVPIGDRWSVMVEDVFPWWNNGNKWAIQMWEMGVEGRYWFKHNKHYSQKLSGHFMGAYTMSGKYDLQWKRDLSYQGEFWSAGATYGYAFPLGKRFKLELSASLGFMSIAYRHYIPSNDYGMLFKDLEKQGRISYFGPTKLKASLVLPLYLSYQKKGGAR